MSMPLGKLGCFVHKNFTVLEFAILLTLTEKDRIMMLAVQLAANRLINRRCHNG